jgi:hypothetical protein
MKNIKKVFTATLIFLIIVALAGIIYVLQFKEETPDIQDTKKASKQIIKKKAKPKERLKTAPGKPVPLRIVAIIIDDIGYDLNAARELLKIDADLTFAILPMLSHSSEAAEMLHKAGRETLLHLPMEPVSYPREKPGEGALFTDMNDEEIILQLKKNIASVPHISGVNNHMGSKFMRDEQKLALIFRELKKNKLFFVDSRTSPDSKTVSAAKSTGLKIAERKIFIDHQRDYKEIYGNLVKVAKSDDRSPKIMIGHPYPETIRALKDAAKVFKKNGVSIVPVSEIIKQHDSANRS